MNDFFSKEELLSELGPSPSIASVAKFLREPVTLIYRKLYRGELDRLPGTPIKISIRSLLGYLNGGAVHVKAKATNPAGRPRKVKEEVAA